MHGHTGSSEAEVTWRALLVAIETRSQVDPLFVACAQPGDCLSPMQVGDSMLFLNVSLETYVQCLEDTQIGYTSGQKSILHTSNYHLKYSYSGLSTTLYDIMTNP